MVIPGGVLFLSGMFTLFTFEGIILLVITVGLAGVGHHKQRGSLTIISLIIILLTFVVNLHMYPLFPTGTLGPELVGGTDVEKSIFNLGLVFLPVVIISIGMLLSRK